MGFENASLMAADVYRCIGGGACGTSLRLALVRGQALKAPRAASTLSVLSGTAWVSFGGEDLLLCRGESLRLEPRRRDPVIVSAVGEEGLFFELD
jgi:hypothetical protein